MTTTKRILNLDASALSKGSCLCRLHLILAGYRTKRTGNNIEYGSAVHVFKENYKSNKDNLGHALGAAYKYFREADFEIERGKEYLDITHLGATCMHYAEELETNVELKLFHTLSQAGKPLLENTFSFPYLETPEVLVNLQGTIDDIGRMGDTGCYVIDDLKTTTFWNAQTYFRQYLLSPQLMFYKFVVGLYGERDPDSIFGEIARAGDLRCSITAAFLSKDKPVSFKRKLFTYSKEQMLEFRIALDELITRLIKSSERPVREGMLNGSCKGTYGEGDECKYFPACSAPGEGAMELMLKSHYKQVEYTPLAFRKQKKSEVV